MQERDRSIEYLQRDKQSNRPKECLTKDDVGKEELIELNKVHDETPQNENTKEPNHIALRLLGHSGEQYEEPVGRRHVVHYYRTVQTFCYNFLERPTGWISFTYHITLFLLVLLSLILSVLYTVKTLNQDDIQKALAILEVILLVWFTLEYICRLWAAGCRSSYVGCRGRLKFAIKPFCLLDVAVILSTLAVITQTQGGVIHASAVRMLRFLQLLRLLRLDRRGGSWSLLGSVVYVHRQELLTTFYIGFLSLIFVSYLVYSVEQNHNEEFDNFAEALWWGVVSLTTVGYGDKTPKTWEGRMIAAAFLLSGISFFALPAGILGSGFALKVTQQQRQKHFNRRRRPAAILMQCFWRLHAADSNHPLIVTWLPDIYSKTRGSPVPGRKTPDSRDYRRHSSPDTKIEGEKSVIKPLTRKISLFARTPEMARRIDPIFGTIKEEESDSDILNNEILNSEPDFNRVNIDDKDGIMPYEIDATAPPKKRRESSPAPFSSITNSQLAVPVVVPSAPQVVELTPAMKHAIRLVRYLKLRVAVRKFKEARRPYDVKDVIEQYSAGHVEMLSRIKNVQTKVEDAFGDISTGPKVEGTPRHNISTRLSKVEKQVKTIDRKIDFLIRIIELHGKADTLFRSTDSFGDGGGGGAGRPSSFHGRASSPPDRAAPKLATSTSSPSDGASATTKPSEDQSKSSESLTLYKPLTQSEKELDVPEVVLTKPAVEPAGIPTTSAHLQKPAERNNNEGDQFKEFKSKLDSRRRRKPDIEGPTRGTRPKVETVKETNVDDPGKGPWMHPTLCPRPSDASVSSVESAPFSGARPPVPPNGHVFNVVDNPTFKRDPDMISVDSGVMSPRTVTSPPPLEHQSSLDSDIARPRLRRSYPVYETTDRVDV